MNLVEEFDNIDIGIFPITKEELLSYINTALYDLTKEKDNLRDAIAYNYFRRVYDVLESVISFDFDFDISFYKEDLILLKEMFLICKKYREYFKVIEQCDGDDLEGLYKLSIITNNNFRNNINYFESLRTNLNLFYSDIYFRDSRYVDNREEFEEFFNDMEKVYGKRY